MLVPEYELKRDLTEPVRGAYDFSAADALLAFSMANRVLSHRARPALDLDHLSTRGNLQDLAQFLAHQLAQLFIGGIEQRGMVRPAQEDTQNGLAGSCASRKLAMDEGAGQDQASLSCRNEEAEAGRQRVEIRAVVHKIDGDR